MCFSYFDFENENGVFLRVCGAGAGWMDEWVGCNTIYIIIKIM